MTIGTPFGGTKNSGIGREESADELLSYFETKAFHIRIRTPEQQLDRVRATGRKLS